MAADKNMTNSPGGPYMIQDRDHLGEAGQMDGQSSHDSGRQAEQGQSETRRQDGEQDQGSAQQGGERRQRRSKLL